MIDIVIADRRWRKPGLAARLKKAASAALRQQKVQRASLTILLADNDQLQALNKDFRGKNKPTNVLSFPAADNEEGYLGDVALAAGVVAREARDAKKRFGDHATHLVVHGVLHLLGYDHEKPKDAKIMEPLEVAILKKLGISDPYAVRA
jgi:probable rRNA maturation factor